VRFALWLVLILVGVVAGLAAVAVAMGLFHTSHGHIHEPLAVTLRLVDRETGAPLEGAVLATVATPLFLESEHFDAQLDGVLGLLDRDPEESWTYGWICAGRTDSRAETTLRSAVYVTRYWCGPFEVKRKVHAPELLLVQHSRCGRIVLPIEPAAPLAEGDAPRTWRLDLGTVLVPR